MSEWICPRPKRLKIPPKNSLSETRCLTDLVNVYTNYYQVERKPEPSLSELISRYFGSDYPYYKESDNMVKKLAVGFLLNRKEHYDLLIDRVEDERGNIFLPDYWRRHPGVIEIPYLDVRIYLRWLKIKLAKDRDRMSDLIYDSMYSKWYSDPDFDPDSDEDRNSYKSKHRKDCKGGKTEYREKYGSHNKKRYI
jgi:hypothetical protein